MPTMTPTPYTDAEIAGLLSQRLHDHADYWSGRVTPQDLGSPAERLDGLAFSVLATFDGNTLTLPPFALARRADNPGASSLTLGPPLLDDATAARVQALLDRLPAPRADLLPDRALLMDLAALTDALTPASQRAVSDACDALIAALVGRLNGHWVIRADPGPDDRAEAKAAGERWYPAAGVLRRPVQEGLHEEWDLFRRTRGV